jgi:hypothetical protein
MKPLLLEGDCDPEAPSEDLAPLADALAGPALGRFSGTIWSRRHGHRPDVLSVRLRIADEQDLRFVTTKRRWTAPFALLSTDVDDYLSNFYFGVSPFRCRGVPRRFWLRLRPIRTEIQDGADTREDRLLLALRHADVGFGIDASYLPRVGWREIARVTFDRVADREEAVPRFDVLRDGRGVRPTGIVPAVRRTLVSAMR